MHGDWKLTVGATGMVAPDFEGAKDMMFSVSPIISLGKAGPEARFTSRNDNISISLFDNGAFRAGLNGKFLFARDDGDSDELRGLDPVRWGGETRRLRGILSDRLAARARRGAARHQVA